MDWGELQGLLPFETNSVLSTWENRRLGDDPYSAYVQGEKPLASGIMILGYYEWAVVGVIGVVKRRIEVATVWRHRRISLVTPLWWHNFHGNLVYVYIGAYSKLSSTGHHFSFAHFLGNSRTWRFKSKIPSLKTNPNSHIGSPTTFTQTYRITIVRWTFMEVIVVVLGLHTHEN